MKKFYLLTSIFALFFTGVCFAERAPWEKTSLNQVSKSISKALVRIAGRDAFDTVETKQTSQIKIYKATWTQNGQKHTAVVTDNGDTVRIAETVNQKDVPEKIQKLASQHFADAKEIKFEKGFVFVYDITPEGNQGPQNHFRMTPTGKVFTQASEKDSGGNMTGRSKIAIDQIPAKTLEALKQFSRQGQITRSFAKKELGETSYGIIWSQGDIEHAAIVMENGTLLKLERDLFPAVIPDFVKESAKKHFNNVQNLEYQQEKIIVYDMIPAGAQDEGRKNHLLLTPAGKKLEIQYSQK